MGEKKVGHGQHLTAVNHPIRREMLRTVYEAEKISETELLEKLKEANIVDDVNLFTYHMGFLLQALCVEKLENEGSPSYKILPSGRVIENF